jgi:protein SCO1/2
MKRAAGMNITRQVALAIAVILLAFQAVTCTAAQPPMRNATNEVGFDQRLGAEIPRDLEFRNEAGAPVRLGDLFANRPIILALVYYRCPLLCNQVLTGLTRSLKPLSKSAGTDFDVLAVSINPDESSELASQKRKAYLELYDRPGTDRGWQFLVGDASTIGNLCSTVGFHFQYNPDTRLYAHAAGIVILTSRGRVGRYFYGIEYPPKELQAELDRAARDQVGSPIAHLLLFCYDYDAATGRYTLSIIRLTRVLASLTAITLASFLLFMLSRERKVRSVDGTAPPSSEGIRLRLLEQSAN